MMLWETPILHTILQIHLLKIILKSSKGPSKKYNPTKVKDAESINC